MGFRWEILLAVFVTGVQSYTDTSNFVFKHHSNEELPLVLDSIHQQCPNITRVYTLAEKSVLGVPLYVMEFSTNPGHHQLSKFKLYPVSL